MKATQVAESLIYLNRRANGGKMDNLKLNKLLYFAQGSVLANTGSTLFIDPIEAWREGPVVPEVYHKYKSFGSNDINIAIEMPQIPLDSIAQLYNIVLEFKNTSAIYLTRKSHKGDNPWRRAHNDYEGKTISLEDMIEFFKSDGGKIPTTKDKLLSFAKIEPAEIKDNKLLVHSSFVVG